jgi:hypothetical protein
MIQKCKTKLNKMVEQQDDPPGPRRYGRVERALRLQAELHETTPGEFLRDLVAKGANQTQVSSLLGCSRQAVGYAAMRHGVAFPGIKLDLDSAVHAEDPSCKTFDQYIEKYWQKLGVTQNQIAAKFGLSLSTVRRRVKLWYEAKSGLVRPQPDRTRPRNRRSRLHEEDA